MVDAFAHARFRTEVLPHIDAAYNLARWIVGSDSDAQDVAQEAMLRAFRAFSQHRGENARAWLLAIVRNCAFTHRQAKYRRDDAVEFDETSHGQNVQADSDPSEIAARRGDAATVKAAIAELPVEFREVIVLRELEQLDYKQIAAVIGVPIGTVMSRLARARARLRESLRIYEEAK